MHNFIKLLIVFFLYLSCGAYGLSEKKEDVTDSNAVVDSPYRWIEKEKMRAGYLYYYNHVSKINLVKKLGLNTIILKCWEFDNAKNTLNTINHIKKWGKAAKENNLHLFVAINWQPYLYMDLFDFRRVVYEDGLEGIAVCPLSKRFWKEHIKKNSLLIASLSNNPNIQIDGMFLDTEIYGSEKELPERRNYYEKKCGFSDICFSHYLIYKGYESSKFPLVGKKDRKKWLEEEGLLEDYFLFLRKQIQKEAENLRDSINEINPGFIIGMYPHPTKNNWVRYPLAKGFSSEKLPLIVFGVHSYGYPKDENGDGYTFIPKDIKQQYEAEGINSLYSAGYLFGRYAGTVLEKNLFQSISNWDGYWLYKLPQLWEENSKHDKLMDSAENLVKAVTAVNVGKD